MTRLELGDVSIQMSGVTRVFGAGRSEVRALDGIDLAVRRGELVVILGPSGSGKTTLLNMIGAIDVPTEGTIRVVGVDIGALDDRGRTAYRREHVGFSGSAILMAFAANATVIAGLFGAIAVAHEYGHGTVIPTFLSSPRRQSPRLLLRADRLSGNLALSRGRGAGRGAQLR